MLAAGLSEMIGPVVKSSQASGNERDSTVSHINQVSVKPGSAAWIMGCMNNAQIWFQFEFKGVEAKGQSLPD
jgi:hypothetical protein